MAGIHDQSFISQPGLELLQQRSQGVAFIHKDAEEVIYILSGRGISGLHDTEVEMKQGETMFVPRGAVHWFYNPFPEPVEMLFLYTRPTLHAAGYQVVG
jgi:mannose-6-phosphate isomerase-like protein (cupin superfamily)